MLDLKNRNISLANEGSEFERGAFHWLKDQCAKQQGRFFYWCPFFMALGIGIYFFLPIEPPVILTWTSLLLSLSCIAFANKERKNLILAFVALCLLPAIGFMAAKYHLMRVHTPVLVEDMGPVTVSGVIDSIELSKIDYDARVILSDVVIEDLEAQSTPERVRLRLRRDYGVQVGQKISALAELMSPSEPLMPDGFNFRKHLYFQNIGAVGFIYKDVEILENNVRSNFSSLIETARHEITERVFNALPEDRASIATALVNGYRAGILDENRDALREAGLAHLLAISGLHIGLVCGALFFFVRLLMTASGSFALRHPIKKYAALFAMGGGLIYMFLAGSTIPTQRAMLMSSVVFLAIILDRSPISLRLVAIAAMIVLVISPHSLLTASFQLSFAAVVGLVAFYEWMRPKLSEWRRAMTGSQKLAFYFLGIALTSVIAGLATAPFALYHFQKFATYGILGNMVAIPVMAFWVMPSAILALTLMPFNMEALPLMIMGIGVSQILEIAHFVSSLEGSVFRVPVFSFWIFLPIVSGLLFFVLWQGALRYCGLALSFLCFGYIFILKQPDILISSNHKLIALTQPQEQFRVNTLRREKFTRENWERSFALEEDSSQLIGSYEVDLCGDLGCRSEIKGRKVSYTLSPYAHREECSWADLLIAKNPVVIDCNAQVIDRFDVHIGGAHGVYLKEKHEPNIKTVRDTIKIERPWNGYVDASGKSLED